MPVLGLSDATSNRNAEGDTVCAWDGAVRVNGTLLGGVLAEDAEGRALPRFAGCEVLTHGRVFVGSSHPRSFDSRVFGPVDIHLVQGTVRPLWTF